MIDPKHPFTIHHTYTGHHCAMCAKAPHLHSADHWLVNGERVTDQVAQRQALYQANENRWNWVFAMRKPRLR